MTTCDKLNALSTAYRLADQQAALKWAKENLPEDEYQKIQRSYSLIIKRFLIFTFTCFLPIIFACVYVIMEAPFSTKAEAEATPEGATGYKLAHIDRSGNFYWTNDSKVYEYSLEEYGLSSEDYEFGDTVKVYVDDEQNVISVVDDGPDIRIIEAIGGIACAIIIPVLLALCVFAPITYRTYGKPWRDFYREYR